MRTARGRSPRSRHPGRRSSRSRSQRSAAGVCWTFLEVERQNARNVRCALFDGGLHAERGHLETVTHVRSDTAEKLGLAGLEVRASDSRIRSMEPQRYPRRVKAPIIS